MREAIPYLRVIEQCGGERGRMATLCITNHLRSLYPEGRIVCTAMVAGHRELTSADSLAALIDCQYGRHGSFLQDVQ
jgi:hypothetical protein